MPQAPAPGSSTATTAFVLVVAVLAWLALLAAGCGGPGDDAGAGGASRFAGATGDGGRLVLLVSIDTLRRDHLGRYGYGRDASPRIDSFAERHAVTFDRAYAQAPFTLPSHMSLMTGLYPHGHDVRLPVQGSGPPVLDERVPTLAERFAAAGFRTAAFTDGGLMDGAFGFARGFEVYDDERVAAHVDNGFERFEGDLHTWIREHRGEDQFVFVHTFDVHGPYEAPEPFADRFREEEPGRPLPDAALLVPSLLHGHGYLDLRGYEDVKAVVDAYDACIRFVDDRVGALLDVVEEAGLFDDAIIAIVSDHGEDFFEDGVTIGHTRFLTEPVLRVPLLLKLPGGVHAGVRSDALVELVDVFPTLLEAAGIAAGSGTAGSRVELDGASLLAGLGPSPPAASDFAFATGPFGGDQHVLVRGDVKFHAAIERPLGEFASLEFAARRPRSSDEPRGPYDFEEDPYGLLGIVPCEDRLLSTVERTGFAPLEIEDPPLLERMRSEAEAIEARGRSLGFSSTPGRGFGDDTKRQLEALGYVAALEGSESAAGGETDGGPGGGPGGGSGGEAGAPQLDCADVATDLDVDRSDLHRGDAALWALYRARLGLAAAPTSGEADRLAAEARAAWAAFRDDHPALASWTRWRFDQLDRELEELEAAEER